MNHQELYQDLLEAVKDYFATNATYEQKYPAYNAICEHVSGRAVKDAAKRNGQADGWAWSGREVAQ